MSGIDISVIICTHNRADSLRQTLESLKVAEHAGLNVEVLVSDNASTDRTRQVVADLQDALQIRYVYVPEPGKSRALNAALGLGEFGEIVAFIDDDISVCQGWFRAVKASSERRPDCDFFTGNSHVVWPVSGPPAWAASGAVNSWAFSVMNWGSEDRALTPKHWPGGGYWWIRSWVLATGIRFDEPLNAEFAPTGRVSDPDFVLQLMACGLRGVAVPEAAAGHRIQENLLHPETIRRRAMAVGRALPYVRCTYPQVCWQARLFRDHPVLCVCLCALNAARYGAACLMAALRRRPDERLVGQGNALLGFCNNLEVVLHWRSVRRKLTENTLKVERLAGALASAKALRGASPERLTPSSVRVEDRVGS